MKLYPWQLDVLKKLAEFRKSGGKLVVSLPRQQGRGALQKALDSHREEIREQAKDAVKGMIIFDEASDIPEEIWEEGS